MPKFKIHAIRTIAIDFEITAVDSEAAEAAISYLLAMSPIIFVPIDPSTTPRLRARRREALAAPNQPEVNYALGFTSPNNHLKCDRESLISGFWRIAASTPGGSR